MKVVPDGVYDGIVHSVGLGKQRAPDGSQGTDVGPFEDPCVVGDEIGCPGEEPQRDGHQCDFGQLALGAGLSSF